MSLSATQHAALDAASLVGATATALLFEGKRNHKQHWQHFLSDTELCKTSGPPCKHQILAFLFAFFFVRWPTHAKSIPCDLPFQKKKDSLKHPASARCIFGGVWLTSGLPQTKHTRYFVQKKDMMSTWRTRGELKGPVDLKLFE